MERPYKDNPWDALLKARDALVVLEESDVVDFYSSDNPDLTTIMTAINDEIDWRYKNDKREGGE